MFHQHKILLFWSRACTCLPRNVSTNMAPPSYTCPFILIGWARCPSSSSPHLTLSSLLENVAQRQPPNISYLFNTQHLPLKARGQKAKVVSFKRPKVRCQGLSWWRNTSRTRSLTMECWTQKNTVSYFQTTDSN